MKVKELTNNQNFDTNCYVKIYKVTGQTSWRDMPPTLVTYGGEKIPEHIANAEIGYMTTDEEGAIILEV